MKPKHIKLSAFLQNAAEIRELKRRLRETSRTPQHSAACAEFHSKYDGLAFPGGLKRQLGLLTEGDKQAVGNAVVFLEADPRFFRSGYIKEKVLRRLKHVPLTAHQREVLGRLVIRSVDLGGRREFHAYARLAGVLGNPEVDRAMQKRESSLDPEVARRAREVLHLIRSRSSEAQPTSRSS